MFVSYSGEGGGGEITAITDGGLCVISVLSVVSFEGGGGEIMAITDGGPFLVLSVARVEVVRTRRSLMVVCV